MTQTKTKERLEYEKAMKNLHELSLKAALSEDGINVSQVPRQKLDEIRRLLSSQALVRQKYQEIITRAQTEANAAVTKAQQDMQAELTGIHNEVEETIKQIKIEQGIIKPPGAEAEQEKQPEAKAQSVEGAEVQPGE